MTWADHALAFMLVVLNPAASVWLIAPIVRHAVVDLANGFIDYRATASGDAALA